MKTRYFVLVLALSSFIALSLSAEEQGWSFPSLNPFKKSDEIAAKSKKKASAKANDEPGFNWKFWQAKESAPKTRSNQPSTWQKMTNGTKNMVAKTKDTLNPWKSTESPSKKPPTGINSFASSKKPKKKPGFFEGWGAESEAEIRKKKSLETVQDFIARDSPE